MAFLIGGANTLDTGDFVTNSIRFNRGDNGVLEKTFSGSPTSTTSCTISFWTKLADPSDTNGKAMFSAIKSGSAEDCIKWGGENSGLLNFLEVMLNNTGDGALMAGDGSTLTLFRDPSAWYHFVFAFDTTDGTANNRMKVYVNGTQIDMESSISGGSVQADTDVSQNYAMGFLTASKHQIGMNVESSNTEPYDGYISEFHFVDGQQYAATVFGEVDDNGVWIPKDCKNDITYGNYGFYLQFKQTGTSANASGMGADTSGNDNHFSASGLAADHIVTDTPQNNFATLNPLISKENGANTYSEGNCKISTSADDYASGVSTIGVSKGKWYYEVKLISTGGTDGYSVGITADPNEDARLDVGDGNHAPLGNKAWSYALNSYGTSSAKAIALNSGSEIDSNDSWAYQSANDIQMVALDMDNNKLYFGANGTWGNSSDPTSGSTGTGAVDVSTSYDIYFVGAGSGNNSNSTVFELNFGNPPFSISSGNADANGYGNFEYAPPSGYYALCTKNLAEYG
tara:strand:- start:14 stop:1549 length:1536 start_codon:yes stop_codon:yes gene_type:complete